jgi:prevent-host-death family protein
MRKTSLADAKARLSALVDQARSKGRSTLILRHGKPSAAIVPVDVALGTARSTRAPLSRREIRALFARLNRGRGRPGAVADLVRGRR